MEEIKKLPSEFNAIIKLATNGSKNKWHKSLYRDLLLNELTDIYYGLNSIKIQEDSIHNPSSHTEFNRLSKEMSKEKKGKNIEELRKNIDESHKDIEKILDTCWDRFKKYQLYDLQKKNYGVT